MQLCTTVACAFLISLVYGSPAPVASPTITPAARLRRAALETFAWTSNSTENGETFYSPWIYNPEKSTWTTSDEYFRRCSVSSTCPMWTACSEGWMVGEGTSSSCGAGGAAGSVFCSNNVLFESLGATRTYSWYWCDSAPVTGYTFYQQEPQQPTHASASTPASTDASTTTTSTTSSHSPSTTTNLTATPTSTADSKFSISIGGVAGGIIGGLVGLAALCAGILFFLRRRKRKTLYAAPTHQPPQNPFDTPASSYATPAPYGGLEAKPPGVAAGTYGWGGAMYPQGPYDPHYGAAEMPAQPPTRNGVAEMDAGSYIPAKYAHGTDVPLQAMSPPAELPSQGLGLQELPTRR